MVSLAASRACKEIHTVCYGPGSFKMDYFMLGLLKLYTQLLDPSLEPTVYVQLGFIKKNKKIDDQLTAPPENKCLFFLLLCF